MSAEMMHAFDLAIERLTAPPKTPAERLFAQLSPQDQLEALDTWLGKRRDPDGWIQDALTCVNPKTVRALLKADDLLAIGELVKREWLKFGPRIYED
jgi:hypothetical protein